ncbi:MAG: nitroreductase family protein [Desulfocapsaceae bacterium]|nr:nitroreductase family protein [Desulfocapsaceae bacterium]
MQELGQIIRERRSIRRYEERAVEKEKLTAVLEAGRWAPSWGNSQCWEIIVVQEKELKEKLSGTLTKKNPATLTVMDAPVVLAMCSESKKSGYYNGQQITRYQDWLLYDLGLASQNVCLAAHDLGLGTVIVGAFDHGLVEKILGIPDGYQVVSLIPMGYPAHAPSAPKRRELTSFVHYDNF